MNHELRKILTHLFFLIFDLIWRIKMNQNESIRSEPCLGGEKVTTKMVMRKDFWRFQAV